MTAEKGEREKAQRLIAENRKARHDYHILETWESGVALLGTEVKAIREYALICVTAMPGLTTAKYG